MSHMGMISSAERKLNNQGTRQPVLWTSVKLFPLANGFKNTVAWQQGCASVVGAGGVSQRVLDHRTTRNFAKAAGP